MQSAQRYRDDGSCKPRRGQWKSSPAGALGRAPTTELIYADFGKAPSLMDRGAIISPTATMNTKRKKATARGRNGVRKFSSAVDNRPRASGVRSASPTVWSDRTLASQFSQNSLFIESHNARPANAPIATPQHRVAPSARYSLSRGRAFFGTRLRGGAFSQDLRLTAAETMLAILPPIKMVSFQFSPPRCESKGAATPHRSQNPKSALGPRTTDSAPQAPHGYFFRLRNHQTIRRSTVICPDDNILDPCNGARSWTAQYQ